MEEKIKQLYEKINYLGYASAKNNELKYIENVKKILPEIQVFAHWFLNGNIFEIDDNLYENLCNDLVDILKDCIKAIDQNDRVLLLDALEYGISEYLKIFLPEKYLMEKDK